MSALVAPGEVVETKILLTETKSGRIDYIISLLSLIKNSCLYNQVEPFIMSYNVFLARAAYKDNKNEGEKNPVLGLPLEIKYV